MTTGLYIRTGVSAQIGISTMSSPQILTGYLRSSEPSSANRFVYLANPVWTTALVKLQPWSQQTRRGWIVSRDLHMSMPLVLLCTMKLFWLFWLEFGSLRFRYLINTRSLPLSQHFHSVGHWVWTSHQNCAYLSCLSTFLELTPSTAGLFCPCWTRCTSLPLNISWRRSNIVR